MDWPSEVVIQTLRCHPLQCMPFAPCHSLCIKVSPMKRHSFSFKLCGALVISAVNNVSFVCLFFTSTVINYNNKWDRLNSIWKSDNLIICYFAELTRQADDPRQHWAVAGAQPQKPDCLGFSLTLPFTSCVTLGKSLLFFVPVFSSLMGEGNVMVTALLFLRWLKGMMFVQFLEQCLPGIVNM